MPPTAKELEDQIALRRARFESIVSEVRAVIVDDVPNWALREAKEAFLGQPQKASDMGEDAIKGFKAAVTAFGDGAATALAEGLGAEELWLEGAHTTDNPRSLRDSGVWARIVELVDGPFNALLSEHGLSGDEPHAFKGPVYFVAGRYYPALAEHYWKLRAELVDLQTEAEELAAQETRASLLDRWDSA